MSTSDVLPARNNSIDGPPSSLGPGRIIPNAQLLFWSCLVGVIGGGLAIVYYYILFGAIKLVWGYATNFVGVHFSAEPAFNLKILLVTTIGGFCVGIVLKVMGVPGEIAAVVNNIHLKRGRMDVKQTPSMVVNSLVSITAGGSAGPEAPLVQIIGSVGSFLGDKLKLRGDLVRTLTFCGMGTALGAFFGAPLGGALFALEIPHRRGLEYFEALIPTILAAIIGFFVFRSFIGYSPVVYHVPPVDHLTLMQVGAGVVFGLLGGAVGAVFILLFGFMEGIFHPFTKHKILLATAGGLLIGLIAQVQPLTLFWAEWQIPELLKAGPNLISMHGLRMAMTMLLLLAFLKMIAVGVTLHSGFRGGFIFPLFFIGAAIGLAITMAFPGLPKPVVILSMMAAVNVAVTKTPISTAVILSTLAGAACMPALIAACFASFFLTTQFSLIRTQRSRVIQPIPIEGFDESRPAEGSAAAANDVPPVAVS